MRVGDYADLLNLVHWTNNEPPISYRATNSAAHIEKPEKRKPLGIPLPGCAVAEKGSSLPQRLFVCKMTEEIQLNLAIPTSLMERIAQVAEYDEKTLEHWAIRSLETSCKTLEQEMKDPVLRAIWKRKR